MMPPPGRCRSRPLRIFRRVGSRVCNAVVSLTFAFVRRAYSMVSRCFFSLRRQGLPIWKMRPGNWWTNREGIGMPVPNLLACGNRPTQTRTRTLTIGSPSRLSHHVDCGRCISLEQHRHTRVVRNTHCVQRKSHASNQASVADLRTRAGRFPGCQDFFQTGPTGRIQDPGLSRNLTVKRRSSFTGSAITGLPS